jgi:hypothetical protein
MLRIVCHQISLGWLNQDVNNPNNIWLFMIALASLSSFQTKFHNSWCSQPNYQWYMLEDQPDIRRNFFFGNSYNIIKDEQK